jgi:hypothetical protein
MVCVAWSVDKKRRVNVGAGLGESHGEPDTKPAVAGGGWIVGSGEGVAA